MISDSESEFMEAETCGLLDDIVTKKSCTDLVGRIIRTFQGIYTGREVEDPDGLNPEAEQVQVAWIGGAVENVGISELVLLDRNFRLGDLVEQKSQQGKRYGMIINSEQELNVECAEYVENGRIGESVITGIRRGLGLVDNSSWHLEPLHRLIPPDAMVTNGQWIGICDDVKIDYVIELDSGHSFIFEDGMSGVYPKPTGGIWTEGRSFHPGQQVQIKGEWMNEFINQLSQDGQGLDEISVASGFVTYFSVRSAKVIWIACAPSNKEERIITDGVISCSNPNPVIMSRIQDPTKLDIFERINTILGDAVYVGKSKDEDHHLYLVTGVKSKFTCVWDDGRIDSHVDGRNLKLQNSKKSLGFNQAYNYIPNSFVRMRPSGDVIRIQNLRGKTRRGGGIDLYSRSIMGERLSRLQVGQYARMWVKRSLQQQDGNDDESSANDNWEDITDDCMCSSRTSPNTQRISSMVETHDNYQEVATTASHKAARDFISQVRSEIVQDFLSSDMVYPDMTIFSNENGIHGRIPRLYKPANRFKEQDIRTENRAAVDSDKVGIVLSSSKQGEMNDGIMVQWIHDFRDFCGYIRSLSREPDESQVWKDGHQWPRWATGIDSKKWFSEPQYMKYDEIMPHPDFTCFPGDFAILVSPHNRERELCPCIQVLQVFDGTIIGCDSKGWITRHAPDEIVCIGITSKDFYESSDDDQDSDSQISHEAIEINDGYSEDDEITTASRESTSLD